MKNIENDHDISVTLTDLCEGMLKATKKNLSGVAQVVDYSVRDIENTEYEYSSFDCVIANHMPYHVQNRDLAIREIARILKSYGAFYATTNSINNIKAFKDLVMSFDS